MKETYFLFNMGVVWNLQVYNYLASNKVIRKSRPSEECYLTADFSYL